MPSSHLGPQAHAPIDLLNHFHGTHSSYRHKCLFNLANDVTSLHTFDSQPLQLWTLNESIITKTGDEVVVQNPA